MASKTRSRFIAIVAAIAAVYVMSQFFRTSNAVIAKDLMRAFELSPEALGVLTGAFFIAFAAAQIPLGIMFDRYGARRTLPILLAFAVAGGIVYGFAGGFTTLLVGRLLMGLGVSCVLMGALFLFGRWVSPDRYGTWMGRMIAMGGAGGILSTTPLAYVAQTIGWPYAFFGTAAITAIGAVLVYAVVRDAPPGHRAHGRPPESLAETWRGLGEVLRNRRLPPILAMAFASYPITITVLGLWGGPYLIDVHGLNPVHAGNVLLIMAVALILGSAGIGPLERRLNTRKWLAIALSCTVALCLALLALLPAPPLVAVVVLLAIIGMCGSFNVVVASHGRSLFPDRLAGRGMAMLGIALMGGPAIMQSVTGLIIGAFDAVGGAAPPVAYRTVFGFLSGVMLLAILTYLPLGDAKPSAGFASEDSATSE